MKKTLYLFVAIVTCVALMTGCSFFNKPDTSEKEDPTVSSETEKDTTDSVTTEDEGDEISVDNPQDTVSDQPSTEDKSDSSDHKDSSNPRDNVASDTAKEYSASGKYCGFIDSTSVEIELSDGSYCTFFVYAEDVRSTLSALDEEDMPEISFTYKAKDGQVNPEMTSVIGG